MTNLNLGLVPVAISLLFLSACASLGSTAVDSKDISVESKTVASTESVAPTKTASVSKNTPKSKNGMICKRRKPVGSSFYKEVCYTKEGWEKLAAGGKDATAKFQREYGFQGIR